MSDPANPSSPAEVATRWIVAICAVAGLFLGLIVYSLRDSVYESEAIVTILNPSGTIAEEAALIQSETILGPAAEALGFEPDISVTAVTGVLTITARANAPEAASNAANAVAALYVDRQRILATSLASEAVPNPDPVAPNQLAHILIGSLLGAMVGGAGFAATRMADFLPERRETEFERPTPIRPPREPSADLHVLVDGPQLELAEPDELGGGFDAAVARMPIRELLGAEDEGPGSTRDPTPTAIDSDSHQAELHELDPFDIEELDHEMADIGFDESELTLEWGGGEAPEPTPPAGYTPSAFSTLSGSLVASPPVTESAWREGHAHEVQGDLADVELQEDDIQEDGLEEDGLEEDDIEEDGLDDDLREHGDPRDATGDDFGSPDAEAPTTGGTWSQAAVTFIPAPAPELSPAGSAAPSEATGWGEPSDLEQDRIDQLASQHERHIQQVEFDHAAELSQAAATYEREASELKRQLADARKQGRIATARLKRLSGDDQHRVGDLEAQATALEAEIATLRGQLEAERIAHLTELTNERDAADRSLDNARRDFEDRSQAAADDNRRILAESRQALDEELAGIRAEHQAALDRQHREYDDALRRERARSKEDLARLSERHIDELEAARQQGDDEAERRNHDTKATIRDLRSSEKRLAAQVEHLEQAERQYRSELARHRSQQTDLLRKSRETEQSLQDELAMVKKSLANEKDRNAALREDVVRRTAEAHQAVDRAIEDRSAQLAELEALVAQQRRHAEERVREATTSAEERARDAARREADLTARISRLERELSEARSATS
ncbi:MAG: hypothetical protein AAF567_15115 [Actinomycetota bacterium]